MSNERSSNFEEMIMRWRYIQRSKPVSSDRLIYFEKYAEQSANRYYHRFQYAFSSAGYDLEDVRSLARVFMFSYLGNFSIEDVPARAAAKIPTLKDKSKKNIHMKNIADLVLFIRQRLIEAAQKCSVKSQNFYGDEMVKAFFIGPEGSCAEPSAILESPEIHGFTKITGVEFNKIRSSISKKYRASAEIPIGNGQIIRKIVKLPSPHFQLEMDSEDSEIIVTKEISNAYAKISTQTSLTSIDYEINLEKRIVEFESLSDERRLSILEAFLVKHKGKKGFSVELRQARKQIKALKNAHQQG